MSSLNAPFGSLCRQVLPFGYKLFESAEIALARQWRWVLWDVEPISYNMGSWLRRTYTWDADGWVLVRSQRGVKGGWRPTFSRRGDAMPGYSQRHTLYMGRVFEDHVPPHKKWPDIAQMQHEWAKFAPVRAHLLLHDGVRA